MSSPLAVKVKLHSIASWFIVYRECGSPLCHVVASDFIYILNFPQENDSLASASRTVPAFEFPELLQVRTYYRRPRQ